MGVNRAQSIENRCLFRIKPKTVTPLLLSPLRQHTKNETLINRKIQKCLTKTPGHSQRKKSNLLGICKASFTFYFMEKMTKIFSFMEKNIVRVERMPKLMVQRVASARVCVDLCHANKLEMKCNFSSHRQSLLTKKNKRKCFTRNILKMRIGCSFVLETIIHRWCTSQMSYL